MSRMIDIEALTHDEAFRLAVRLRELKERVMEGGTLTSEERELVLAIYPQLDETGQHQLFCLLVQDSDNGMTSDERDALDAFADRCCREPELARFCIRQNVPLPDTTLKN